MITDTLEIAIPSELAFVKNDLRRFFDAMVFKLKKNAHKGRWEDYSIQEALRMLGREVIELEEAMGSGNMVEVMLECADVANFALIASNISIDRGK